MPRRRRVPKRDQLTLDSSDSGSQGQEISNPSTSSPVTRVSESSASSSEDAIRPVASTDNDVQRLVAHISRHKSKSLALQLAIEQEKAKQAELTEEIRIIHTIQTKCSVSETTNIPAVSNSSPPQDTLQLDFDDSASTASPLSEPSATPPTNPRTKAAIASLSDKDALRFAAHISRHKSKVLALKLAIQQEKNQASSTAERH